MIKFISCVNTHHSHFSPILLYLIFKIFLFLYKKIRPSSIVAPGDHDFNKIESSIPQDVFTQITAFLV